MTRDDAKQEIRSRYAEYLQPAKKKNTYICPLCGNGTGSTGDGMAVDPHGDRLHLKCFKCNFYGDIIELYQQEHNTTQQEAFNALYSLFNIDLSNYTTSSENTAHGANKAPLAAVEYEPEAAADYTSFYNEARQRITDDAAQEYLKQRGLSLETVAPFWLGYDPAWKNPKRAWLGNREPATPRLIIPTSKGSYVARITRPITEEEIAVQPNLQKAEKAGKVHIFNIKALYADEKSPVFITEGEIDALSIIEAGADAAAIGSTSFTGLLISALKEKPTSRPLIICMDNDEPGRKAEKQLIEGLQRLNIAFITADISGGHKDPNDALTADREAFKAAINDAINQIQGQDKQALTGAAMVDAFLSTVQTQKYKPMATGLPGLDRITGGGFVRQSIVMLAAAPAMGKTTLAMQIFEGMAKQGNDIIYLNLEMSREQLIAKSICRMAYDRHRKTITTAEIMQGYKWTDDQRSTVLAAAEAYKKEIAPHMIYNPDSVTAQLDSIISFLQAEAERYQAEGKPAPLIAIDYLHLIQGTEREDAAATIKRAVTELKNFAVNNSTVVFCILATNRDSNARGKMILESGRDTSNIEFSADLFLGLNFTNWETSNKKEKKSFETLKQQPQREITLKCLKNRMGEDGASMQLLFDTKHGIFTPVDTIHEEVDAWRSRKGTTSKI